jgi:hypothetical protein
MSDTAHWKYQRSASVNSRMLSELGFSWKSRAATAGTIPNGITFMRPEAIDIHPAFDRDYFIPKLGEFPSIPSLELSRLIWRTIASFPAYSNHFQATYQRNQRWGARCVDSSLVHELRAASWVPQKGGQFVRPADALRELLPEGFPFDPGHRWLKAIQFGETATRQSAQALQQDQAAKRLGFADAAAAERARRFNELPESEQEKILAAYENSGKAAVPDRDLANPKRRAENVREQAKKAPDKQSEIRERSVSIGIDEVKEQADTYLREH